jgi:hypothetical protein
MTTASVLDIRQLTDSELADAWSAGRIDLPALEAEAGRRDRAEKAAAKRRASSRARHAEWEAAAYANYLAADAHCRGFLLSDAGKRAGRDPWPMLWEGSRETADRLASDDLITWWDYTSERPPSAAEYAKAKRQAAAEQAARTSPAPSATPTARELAEQAAMAPRQAAPSARDLAEQAATRPAGSIAGMITALGLLERQFNRTARAAVRVSGGNRP